MRFELFAEIREAVASRLRAIRFGGPAWLICVISTAFGLSITDRSALLPDWA